MTDIDSVLEFWAGALDDDGLAAPEQRKKWWSKSDAFDGEVRDGFMETYEAICGGACEGWLQSARGAVAYVIVLDQFSRNMFRGQPKMYEADQRALSAAAAAIDQGFDTALPPVLRTFLYMPFMHSEVLADQDRCVALFEAFNASVSEVVLAEHGSHLDYARQHRKIVADWGRFPHRNEILGRASTAAEADFLTQPGSSF